MRGTKMKLKICSFNSRCDTANDGINNFSCRTGKILEFLKAESPDIIGFQEITPTMREWYVENLTDYYTVGAGRNPDLSGEAPLIAFKKRDMQLVSCDTVMLSSAPKKFGSRYEGSDQSSCPRAYCRVLLKHDKVAEPFYVYNVHTDHIGAAARMLASAQLVQDISTCGRLFFMTGDFNAKPDSPEIALITKSSFISDATASVGGTFHAYGKLDEPVKIDYVFTAKGQIPTECYAVGDNPPDGVYVSDHNPVVAVFEI